jgi:large subunit ribosomal protein L25
MEIPVLEMTKREAVGSRACRRLRSEGQIPAVLYGLKGESEALMFPRAKIDELIRHGVLLVDIADGGKKQSALIKDVQYDHLGDEILHVDFTRVKRGVKVTVTVPLEFEGHAAGVSEGGVIEHPVNDIEVECLPRNIPEKILVDVSSLGIGDHLMVKDITLPEGVEATGDAEIVLATVTFRGAAPGEEEEAEEEIQEPEIIGKKEEEEEEESKD